MRRDVSIVAGWSAALGLAAGALATRGGPGFDSYAYWHAWRGDALYAPTAGRLAGRYLYSPAFAEALWPATALPSMVFWAVLAVAGAAVGWWLLRPVPLALRPLLLVILCGTSLYEGNISTLLAACAVLAYRRPEWWAAAALTKPPLAVVGVLASVRQRGWSGAWRPAVATLAIAGVSAALGPGLWGQWASYLLSGDTHPRTQLLVPQGWEVRVYAARLLVAGALALLCARRQPWVVGPALLLSSPIAGLSSLALLAAVPRLTPRWLDAGAAGQPVRPDQRRAPDHERSPASDGPTIAT